MKKRKLLQKIIISQQNVKFNDMLTLLEAFGFKLSRISGSHYVFVHPELIENINLQNVGGSEILSNQTIFDIGGNV